MERGRVPWQNRPLDFTAYYSSQDAQYLSVISPGPRRFVATISVNRSLIALRILPRIPFVALHPSSMIYRRFIAPLPIQTALLIYEWRDRLSPFELRRLFRFWNRRKLYFLDLRISFLSRNLETIFRSISPWVIIAKSKDIYLKV